jgi:N-acetylglucosaminyl-diphospho-decaprenol L-rhamnosyltransferase
MAEYPRVALLAARILIGSDERLDPTCEAMGESPLGRGPEVPGPRVRGFLACGAVVRRDAFLDAGGFRGRMGVGGEETLLALDLAAAGWELAYVEEIVAHHDPPGGDRPSRTVVEARNALWSAWLRRPLPRATAVTLSHAGRALRDREHLAGVASAARGLPWVARERRVVPARLESELRALGL